MKKEKRKKKKKPQRQEEMINPELEKYKGYEMLLDIEDENLDGDDDPLPMPTGQCQSTSPLFNFLNRHGFVLYEAQIKKTWH